MFERIIEIIVYVISELRQNKHITEIDVSELNKLGYTNTEISTAFSWLVDRVEFSFQYFGNENYSNTSFRILHEAEQELFTNQAWGELIELHSLGLISNEHIEMLIEKALMLGVQEINSSQLKTFVASLIFNGNSKNMPGSRVMLNGYDTIN